jgi:hypothetical protein
MLSGREQHHGIDRKLGWKSRKISENWGWSKSILSSDDIRIYWNIVW